MGKTVVAIVADLILAGFGYLLMMSTVDGIPKILGMLVLVMAICAISVPGKQDNKTA